MYVNFGPARWLTGKNAWDQVWWPEPAPHIPCGRQEDSCTCPGPTPLIQVIKIIYILKAITAMLPCIPRAPAGIAIDILWQLAHIRINTRFTQVLFNPLSFSLVICWLKETGPWSYSFPLNGNLHTVSNTVPITQMQYLQEFVMSFSDVCVWNLCMGVCMYVRAWGNIGSLYLTYWGRGSSWTQNFLFWLTTLASLLWGLPVSTSRRSGFTEGLSIHTKI